MNFFFAVLIILRYLQLCLSCCGFFIQCRSVGSFFGFESEGARERG